MITSRVLRIVAAAGVTGAIVGSVLLPSQVLAWHPVGTITKFVANETSNSASVDANSTDQAVSAKPGDILRYTVTISNKGETDSSGKNDLAFVQLTDTLPDGVELVDTPAQRTITEAIPGTIQPGKSVTKEYRVKVTSATDGAMLKNTACFSGNSTVKDNAQQGCDVAYTKVTVPTPTPTPTPAPTPTPTPTPQELPSTGPEAAIGSLAGLGALSYATVNYRRSKKALKNISK